MCKGAHDIAGKPVTYRTGNESVARIRSIARHRTNVESIIPPPRFSIPPMRSHRLPLICLTLALFSFAAPSPATAHDAAFDRWVDAFAADWMRADPMHATSAQYFTGPEQDALDRKLTPITREFQAQRAAAARRALDELAKFDPKALDPGQRVSAGVLRWQLENVVNDEPFADYHFVFEQFGGVQVRLVDFLTQQHPIRNARDIENYLARLELAAGHIDQAIALAKDRAA